MSTLPTTVKTAPSDLAIDSPRKGAAAKISQASMTIWATAMHPEVKHALDAGDARAFFEMSVKHGYEPPHDDIQHDLLMAGADIVEANHQADEAAIRSAGILRRARKMNFALFGELVAAHPDLPEPPYLGWNIKLLILQSAGYDTIIGAGGIHIPITEARPAQIGRVFASVLKRYKSQER